MHILLPGPTPIPQAVQQAMLTAMSDHRGDAFDEVKQHVLQELASVFGAQPGHVAVIPSSGTGGLEAVVQNLFLPGDAVLLVESGLFGRRFGEVAHAHGLQVERLEIPWGQPFEPQQILARAKGSRVRGILVTHNETSTGVLNPVVELAGALKSMAHPPLLIVDSISGVPSVPLAVENGIDVIIAASQKGFMCPPGLSLAALSRRARSAVLEERPGRYYFDLRPYLAGRFPYTPAVSLWYGLKASLDLLRLEGATARLARHHLLRDTVRTFAKSGGLTLLVPDSAASPTVTALGLPETMNPHQMRSRLEARGLQIAGALGQWHDHAVRIGHVGAVDMGDLAAGLALMAEELPDPQSAMAAIATTLNPKEENTL